MVVMVREGGEGEGEGGREGRGGEGKIVRREGGGATFYSASSPCPDTSSSCDTSNIGLWVDAFNFIVITIQMILLHTSYMDNIRNDINKREGVAIT